MPGSEGTVPPQRGLCFGWNPCLTTKTPSSLAMASKYHCWVAEAMELPTSPPAGATTEFPNSSCEIARSVFPKQQNLNF
jgi:hypothetical protein